MEKNNHDVDSFTFELNKEKSTFVVDNKSIGSIDVLRKIGRDELLNEMSNPSVQMEDEIKINIQKKSLGRDELLNELSNPTVQMQDISEFSKSITDDKYITSDLVEKLSIAGRDEFLNELSNPSVQMNATKKDNITVKVIGRDELLNELSNPSVSMSSEPSISSNLNVNKVQRLSRYAVRAKNFVGRRISKVKSDLVKRKELLLKKKHRIARKNTTSHQK